MTECITDHFEAEAEAVRNVYYGLRKRYYSNKFCYQLAALELAGQSYDNTKSMILSIMNIVEDELLSGNLSRSLHYLIILKYKMEAFEKELTIECRKRFPDLF